MKRTEPEAPIFGANGAVLNAPGMSEELRDDYVSSETYFDEAIARNQFPIKIWHLFVMAFGAAIMALAWRLDTVGLAPKLFVSILPGIGLQIFIAAPIFIILRGIGIFKGLSLSNTKKDDNWPTAD